MGYKSPMPLISFTRLGRRRQGLKPTSQYINRAVLIRFRLSFAWSVHFSVKEKDGASPLPSVMGERIEFAFILCFLGLEAFAF